MPTKTYSPRKQDVDRRWLVVDAAGMPVGRVASRVAALLQGKHKPIFARHVDTGDHVIVVNADKLIVTGDKARKKIVYTHSGYPGGLKARRYGDVLAARPQEALRQAVRGMLPHNRLGRAMLRKLKVYRRADHRHQAQRPRAYPLRPETGEHDA